MSQASSSSGDNKKKRPADVDTHYLLDVFREGLIVTSTGYEILFASRAARQALGISETDPVGRLLNQFIPSLNWDAVVRQEQQALVSGPVEMEHHLDYPGHGTKVLSLLALPQFDDDERHSSTFWLCIDLTAQSAALRELKQSEAGFRRLAENAKDMLYRMSLPDGKYEYVSPASLEILGYSPQEFIESPMLIAKAIHPDWRGFFKEEWARLIRGDMAPTYEYQIIHKSGDIRWLHQRNVLVKDRLGNPVAIEGIVTDITERKRVEQDLLNSRMQLEHAHRLAKIGTWDWDVVTGDVDWSAEVYRIFGLDPVSFTPQIDSILALSPPEEQNRDKELIEKAIRSREVGEFEQRFFRSDGEERVYHSTFEGRYDNGGNLVRMIGTVQDVTEIRRAEMRVREQRDLLKHYMDIAAIFFVILGRDQKVRLINRRGCEILGLREEDVVGKNWFDNFLVLEDVEAVKKVFDRICDGELNAVEYYENPVRSVTGEIRLIAWHNAVMADDSGRILEIISSGEDITDRRREEEERHQLELQVQRTQKMESLGVLAGGIAHDFNNLLMAVIGNADLALEELSDDDPVRESVWEIARAARRATELARQMLAYSGKGKFIVESIQINDLVDEMLHLLHASISKKAELVLQLENDLPPFNGDATQIRQIVMNLITNASDAIGDTPGRIRMSTGMLHYAPGVLGSGWSLHTGLQVDLEPGSYVYFEVDDTGCGMDDQTRERIFDPFFTTKFAGRGLGMAAVLGIIRGHQGAIALRSRLGQGSTFRIMLPVAEVLHEARDGFELEDDQGWRGSGTILLADDDTAVVTVGKRMLEWLGYDVLTAIDGREAVEIYRAHAGEIGGVLLDLTMPHLNGVEVFKELLKINRDVRVILCSGYNEDDAMEQYDVKGLAGFIQKPFLLKDLRRHLRWMAGFGSNDPKA